MRMRYEQLQLHPVPRNPPREFRRSRSSRRSDRCSICSGRTLGSVWSCPLRFVASVISLGRSPSSAARILAARAGHHGPPRPTRTPRVHQAMAVGSAMLARARAAGIQLEDRAVGLIASATTGVADASVRSAARCVTVVLDLASRQASLAGPGHVGR